MEDLTLDESTSSSPDTTSETPDTTAENTETSSESTESAESASTSEATGDTSDAPEAPETLDMASYEKTYAETGSLTDEQYAELERRGFDKETVDTYIEARKTAAEAAVSQRANAALEKAGLNSAEFKTLSEWGAANLSAEDRATYESLTNTDNPNVAAMGLEMLKNRYEAANGKPSNLEGGTSTNSDSKPRFKNKSEQRAAISDPRYGDDREYTREVAMKIANSNFS